MRNLVVVLMIAAPLMILPETGSAKGCLKGAAVGGVAGHVAGHHAILGATAGCVIEHHREKVRDRAAAQNSTSRGPGESRGPGDKPVNFR